MTTLAHNAVFTSYSAPAKAPAPAPERVVHSTLYSSYEAAAVSFAPARGAAAAAAHFSAWSDTPERAAPLAETTPAPRAAVAARSGLGARLAAWRAARRQARADREMWALAKLDARVMTDLTCALSRQD